MKRRRVLLLVAVVALLAGAFLAGPRGPKQPVYQGKKLSRWMREANEDAIRGSSKYSREQIDAARAALRAIGTNAVPYLVSEFFRPPSPRTHEFNRWLTRNNMEHLRLETGQFRRDLAVLALRWLGPDAASALPELVPHFTRPDTGKSAAYAMSQCTAAAVPEVLRCFGTNAAQLELALGHMVTGIGAYYEEFAHIVALVNHTNAVIRGAAAASLRLARYHAGTAAKALLQAQSDADPRVRAQATASLAHLAGTSSKLSPSPLQRLLTNRDTNVAAWASNALFRIDSNALPKAAP